MFRSCKALHAAAAVAALRVDLILMLRQGPSRKVIDAVRNFKSESEPGLLSRWECLQGFGRLTEKCSSF